MFHTIYGKIPGELKTEMNDDSSNDTFSISQIIKIPEVDISYKQQDDDSVIVVTDMYCVKGHNIVRPGGPKFSGYDGISFWVVGKSGGSIVTVSPFHGDPRKYGGEDFEPGEKLTICCPECREPFPSIGKCGCSQDGELISLFLTRDLDPQKAAAVCDKWGCLRSRIIDGEQIIIKHKDDDESGQSE